MSSPGDTTSLTKLPCELALPAAEYRIPPAGCGGGVPQCPVRLQSLGAWTSSYDLDLPSPAPTPLHPSRSLPEECVPAPLSPAFARHGARQLSPVEASAEKELAKARGGVAKDGSFCSFTFAWTFPLTAGGVPMGDADSASDDAPPAGDTTPLTKLSPTDVVLRAEGSASPAA
mmetsp:Transcript_148327/g.413179  ORF Transcript_148327/g.413179 Transcript_148327/m.413179 type:complete len:173 (+) Transcript_148327:46-564(+)